MHVTRFELHRIRIPFKIAFEHARHERKETDAVIVELQSASGLSGFGEILPREYVTGETIPEVLGRIGPVTGARFSDQTFSSQEEVVRFLADGLQQAGRDLATFAGFEIALLDLAGKELGFALGDVLGGEELPPLPAGIVLGFEVDTTSLRRTCMALRFKRQRHIKVKVGLPDDGERLSMIAQAVGVPLRLDANGAWSSADEAVHALRSLMDRSIPIASIEQPLHPADIEGARAIREQTGLAVMADESLCTPEDAERLIEGQAADIFNIRLGKCGGLLASQRLLERARTSGLGCHLGTLVGETGILTRAAEIFSRFVPGFDCLDGKLQNEKLLSSDLLESPRDAVEAPMSNPGLGVLVSIDRVRERRVISTP